MAKHKLGSKQFFTMSVLAVSVLGLIVVTGAALKPTNTQSDASASYGCDKTPNLNLISKKKYTNYIEYAVRLTNTDVHNPAAKTLCPVDRYNLRSNSPDGWKVEYLSENSGTSSIINLNEGQSTEVIITVTPKNTKIGTVQISAINTNQNNITPETTLPLKYGDNDNNNTNTPPANNNNGKANPIKQANCSADPQWKLTGNPTDGSFWVIYHLKLIDNCPGDNDYKIFVSDYPSTPQPNYNGWSWSFANGGTKEAIIKHNVDKNGSPVNLTISRSPSNKPQKGAHRYFTLKAVNTKNNNSAAVINLTYTVE